MPPRRSRRAIGAAESTFSLAGAATAVSKPVVEALVVALEMVVLDELRDRDAEVALTERNELVEALRLDTRAAARSRGSATGGAASPVSRSSCHGSAIVCTRRRPVAARPTRCRQRALRPFPEAPTRGPACRRGSQRPMHRGASAPRATADAGAMGLPIVVREENSRATATENPALDCSFMPSVGALATWFYKKSAYTRPQWPILKLDGTNARVVH